MENFFKSIPKVLIPILPPAWVCTSVCDGECGMRVGGVRCVSDTLAITPFPNAFIIH